MSGKPKKVINDLKKLWASIKKSELEQEGKNLIDASKNVRKGTRPRISVTSKTTAEPEVSKVVILKDNPLLKQTPVELPEFKPYYISDGNPNVLTPAQQAMRDELVKSRQIDLAQHQRELANRGINTPASHRRAGALAVATNPDAIMAPQERMYRLPYSSAIQEWEGAPLGEWFEMASEDMIPYGPNALWRKWYQPLHDATHSFDVLGQNHRGEAPAISMQQLGLGLSQMEPYLGIRPIKKSYISPKSNIVSNYIGPNMEPGLYGYDASTSEWRPLATVAVEHTLGKPDTYSMFSQIGQSPIKFDNNIIESGVNFEGVPFSVIQNKPIEQKIHTFNPFWGREWSGDFNPLWGRGPDYLKQGGILSAKSGIHIKKANRGKFTDYCGGKVTSECIARGKASSNPTIRKRATFAANARKWKHQNGGTIPFWIHNILGGE